MRETVLLLFHENCNLLSSTKLKIKNLPRTKKFTFNIDHLKLKVPPKTLHIIDFPDLLLL